MPSDRRTRPVTGPPSARLSLRVGARTDVGLVRDENQDRISRFRTPLGEVFLVVDGMGGHKGGSQAAEMTVAGLERALTSARPETPPADALRDAAAAAHAEIRHRAESPGTENPEMGATAVMVLLREGRAFVAHAGDSRAYLLRGDRLSRLTNDHTVVQRMVDQGLLSEEEARAHPDASVVSRAFGRSAELELEVAEPFDLQPDDRLMLCSDGLCGYVEDAEIGAALQGSGAQAVADRLTELALAAGGEDNVSVQVLSLRDREGGAASPAPGAAASAAAAGGATRRPRSGEEAVDARGGRRLGLALEVLIAILVGVLVAWLIFHFIVRPGRTPDEPHDQADIEAAKLRGEAPPRAVPRPD
ncbi:MAG TPA: protein phosphatase 2C domain-containing protein, partial [Thermoanaerobaculia bacterium]|nr:protein phosphatase 2C domain-containing protein [Thermoanaerobaculia bacterium]